MLVASYDVLGTSLPPVGTHIGLASYSSSIRRGSARRPLLSPAENKGFAAAAKRPPLCVEIKFRAPHAIDAMVSPQLRLLDGVEVHEEIIYLTG